MALIIKIENNREELISTLIALPKDFKTGSTGYYCSEKAVINGKRYQVMVTVVEIGSKDKKKENL